MSSVAVGLSSLSVFFVNDFHLRAVTHACFKYRAVGLEQAFNTCILCSCVSFLFEIIFAREKAVDVN